MSNELHSLFAKNFDQICFVTTDLDKSIEFFKKANGIETWNVALGLSKDQTDKEYYGKPGNFEFSCAYGYAAETLIELARHDGGDSVYADWLNEGRKGPHHIGFRQHDEAEYLRAIGHYESLGIQKAMAGFFGSPKGNCRWAYYDTREFIGCFTELYYVDGENGKAMELLKKGQNVSITQRG